VVSEQDISFSSDGYNIAGTLTLPDSGGPLPAVLLIPGSGPVDRNENHKKLRINALLEIAEYLSRHGIAAIRYDKRGVGLSEGDFWTTGLFDNVQDAAAGLRYLRDHSRIDPGKVFLLGHSEGALIATRLAAEGAEVAGIVLLAGSAQSGEDVLKWQARQIAKDMRGLNKWLIKLLRINVLKSQQKQIDKIKRSTKNCYRVQLIARLSAKWMREFIGYNPAEDMPKIRVPVLAITGSKDIQINPENLNRMAQLIKTDFEYHELADVTHILRLEEGEPTLATYKRQVKKPIDYRILELVLKWLQRQLDIRSQQ